MNVGIPRPKRIKVRSLEFTDPFRKLSNLTIEFADRLTLIAGHNGIGKSTILALVANTFGLTDRRGERKESYFGEPFYANIERIIYLALAEVGKTQESPAGAPIVAADVNGVTVRKRCAMTQRSEWRRARVVPRTIERQDTDPVGQDAKIPLPTIYLGIKRLAPIGEAEEREVQSRKLDMPNDDSKLMVDFVSSVILGIHVTPDVTHQSIKGSRKKTAQPGYGEHDAQAISLGQDSLASIATALASFNRLMRDWSDYPGGLLVIDELDAGFHPHAIGRLVQALKTQAKRLRLQIIATTHSPGLIEAVHRDGGGSEKAPDKVIYLLDTKRPRLAEDQSLTAVLKDMALLDDEDLSKPAKPVLCVYFEDEQAEQFFNALFPPAKRAGLGRRLGVQIKLISLGVSGSHLVALPDRDPLFKDRVLVVDADTVVPRAAAARGNTLKLPCARAARGTDRSPENTIRLFLQDVVNADKGPLHAALHCFRVVNPSSDKVLATFFSDGAGGSPQRESTKAWWKDRWAKLKQWGVIEAWASCHPIEVAAFIVAFERAIATTAAMTREKLATKGGVAR